MFKESEMPSEMLAKFQNQRVIVAFSKDEVLAKSRILEPWTKISLSYAAARLDRIVTKWKGLGNSWNVLNGARVLDLASGSANCEDYCGDVWYPHFSRLCAVNGAKVVAIDILPQKGLDRELFEGIEGDLVDIAFHEGVQNLPNLKGREFDVIHSSNFVGVNPQPGLVSELMYRGLTIKDLENLLLNQSKELLADGGIIVLDTVSSDRNHLIYRRNRNCFEVFDY